MSLFCGSGQRCLRSRVVKSLEVIVTLVRSFCSKHLDGRPVEQHELPGYRAFSRGETVSRHELQMHFAGSDKTKFVCISATPVRGPDGAIIAAAAVVEDLTTVRAQDEERHRLRAQAEFLATMNHELRSAF